MTLPEFERAQLYGRVIAHWGTAEQWRMVQEEAAELVVAINHALRGRAGETELADAIADMEIMLEQVRYMAAVLVPGLDSEIDAVRKIKLARLLDRIAHEEPASGKSA